MTNLRIQEFFDGVKGELPIVVGVIPFGMIYGVYGIQAGLTPDVTQAMSSIVFAGSAQFATAVLLRQYTPALVIIITAAVLNLRHAFYSASLAPQTQHLSKIWKTILSYLLTDEAFAATIVRYRKDEASARVDYRHWFFLGAGVTLWTSWQISTAAGIFLGLEVPKSWSLDYCLVLTFIGIVVPTLKDRANVLSALAAGLVAVVFAGLPYKLGLFIAAVVGIVTGIFTEKTVMTEKSV